MLLPPGSFLGASKCLPPGCRCHLCSHRPGPEADLLKFDNRHALFQKSFLFFSFISQFLLQRWVPQLWNVVTSCISVLTQEELNLTRRSMASGTSETPSLHSIDSVRDSRNAGHSSEPAPPSSRVQKGLCSQVDFHVLVSSAMLETSEFQACWRCTFNNVCCCCRGIGCIGLDHQTVRHKGQHRHAPALPGIHPSKNLLLGRPQAREAMASQQGEVLQSCKYAVGQRFCQN